MQQDFFQYDTWFNCSTQTALQLTKQRSAEISCVLTAPMITRLCCLCICIYDFCKEHFIASPVRGLSWINLLLESQLKACFSFLISATCEVVLSCSRQRHGDSVFYRSLRGKCRMWSHKETTGMN